MSIETSPLASTTPAEGNTDATASKNAEGIASAAEGWFITSCLTRRFKLTCTREATLYWESRVRDHRGRVEGLLQGVSCV